jgi:hypothetical protein
LTNKIYFDTHTDCTQNLVMIVFTKTTIQSSTWTPTQTIQPSPTRTKAPTWTLLPQMITPSITPTH